MKQRSSPYVEHLEVIRLIITYGRIYYLVLEFVKGIFFLVFLFPLVMMVTPWCILCAERVQKGIAHWDKQNNDVLAPNYMLKVWEEIIKVEGL